MTFYTVSKGNGVSNVNRIVQFIRSDREETLQCSGLSHVKLYALFSQAAAMLEKIFRSDCGELGFSGTWEFEFTSFRTDDDMVAILTQCLDALRVPPVILSSLDTSPNTLRSLEKLRRLCRKVLEGERGGVDLRNVTKLILEAIVESIEIAASSVILPHHLWHICPLTHFNVADIEW